VPRVELSRVVVALQLRKFIRKFGRTTNFVSGDKN
jgi:hypothetical protein